MEFWRNREEPTNKRELDRDKSKNWDFISKVPAEISPKERTTKNEDAKKYWIDKIKEVDNKLENLKINTV